jgi:glycopeptide antibiotics resistance protein
LNISNLLVISLLVFVLVYINIKLFKKRQKRFALAFFIYFEFINFVESRQINDITVIILCIIGLMIMGNSKNEFGGGDGDGFGGDGGGGHH